MTLECIQRQNHPPIAHDGGALKLFAALQATGQGLHQHFYLNQKSVDYKAVLPVVCCNDGDGELGRVYMYSNSFAYVGRRATGTKEGRYVISLQGWRGPLPKGAAQIESPTSHLMALTRTLVRGPADLPAAYAIQQKYTLSPLSQMAHLPLAP